VDKEWAQEHKLAYDNMDVALWWKLHKLVGEAAAINMFQPYYLTMGRIKAAYDVRPEVQGSKMVGDQIHVGGIARDELQRKNFEHFI